MGLGEYREEVEGGLLLGCECSDFLLIVSFSSSFPLLFPHFIFPTDHTRTLSSFLFFCGFWRSVFLFFGSSFLGDGEGRQAPRSRIPQARDALSSPRAPGSLPLSLLPSAWGRG